MVVGLIHSDPGVLPLPAAASDGAASREDVLQGFANFLQARVRSRLRPIQRRLILGLRGSHSHDLRIKVWNSRVHGGLPGLSE